MSLHPLTLKSIEANAVETGEGDYCGCYRHEGQWDFWTLCDYHQGYEDAAQAMQERLDEAVHLVWVEDDVKGNHWALIDGGEKP